MKKNFSVIVFFVFSSLCCIAGNNISNGATVENNGANPATLPPKIVAPETAGDSDKYAYVTSLDSKGKARFLDALLNDAQTHGKMGAQFSYSPQDADHLLHLLSKLVLDEEKQVSGRALMVIKLFSWVQLSRLRLLPDGKKIILPLTDTGIPDTSRSIELKTSLEKLIKDRDTNDKFRSSAIEAHWLSYPPEDAVIHEYEKLLAAGGDHNSGTLSSIFGAYQHYKTFYDFNLPASALESARKLIHHPSESVRGRVFVLLSQTVGKPFLPVLFDALKNSSLGLANEIVMDILLLDHSEETISHLRKIATEETTGSALAHIIETATDPGNIERLRKK